MVDKIQCIIVDDEPIARDVLENHLKGIPIIEIVKKCKNALEAFKVISKKQVDLVFLDINMPEISGLSFAKSINKNIKVIFTTAYREYAVEGFDLQAVDYLLEPISFERLKQAVDKFMGIQESTAQSTLIVKGEEKADFIFLKADRKMIKVAFDDIQYIESLGDYIKIYTAEKRIVSRETISNMEAKLPVKSFMRIHRSFIVSLDKISSFTHEHIEILNKALPISRSFKKEVLKRLDTF